jgi:hypothetical protein
VCVAVQVPLEVGENELLARFIMQSSGRWRADGTVKPEAFMPHPSVELSVTRHLGLSEPQVWETGHTVAAEQNKPLYGRADVVASAFTSVTLTVTAEPTANNANHAYVSGWPADKPAQKSKAQQIVAVASNFIPTPH